jgi:hypothetical protein
MRAILICLVTATMFAADPGVPLRPSPKDCEVAGNADAAKIAAAIIPSKRVRKMFSPEIAKRLQYARHAVAANLVFPKY